MARRRSREEILADALREDMKDRIVDAVVIVGAARFIDLSSVTGIRLNVIWELVRELEYDGSLLIDPIVGGSVFALPKATRAAERRHGRRPVHHGGDAA